MENGTTGVLVAPVQEADMEAIRKLFGNVMAIIETAKTLPATIADLQSKTTSLTHDLESIRANNTRLDETLAHVREQRDKALSEAETLRSQLRTMENDYQTLSDANQRNALDLIKSRDDLDQARKDRDDAAFRNLELSEEADKLRAALDKLYSAMGVPNPYAEKPKDTSSPAMQEPQGTTIWSYAPTALDAPTPSSPTPNPEPVKRRLYEGDPGYNFARAKWDYQEARYYNEA